MRFPRLIVAGIVVAGGLGGQIVAAPNPLSVRDIDGHSWTPLSPSGNDVDLVLFISAECPVTQHYAPEMNRIVAAYSARGVHAWFVFAEPSIPVADVRQNLKDFHPHTTAPAIIDAHFDLTAAAGVTITPEAAIYTARGRVYRGRIDNLYITIGQNRREATTHDLRDALEAVLAGKPVIHPETEAVGCFIERGVR